MPSCPITPHSLAQTLIFALLLVLQDFNAMAQSPSSLGITPVPELVVPDSRAGWETQRGATRARLWQLLGPLPPRPAALSVKTVSRQDHEKYVLERFEFDNGAGATVPGYLFLPKGATSKVPAVLYCHWHGGQYDNGKEEMLRSEHTPVAPGPALAARGYAVLGIDAYCFGERNGHGPGSSERGGAGELTASKFNLWFGRTLWGMILRDDLIALDYLVSRPEIDRERVGVTGISMGATRSWWLMALDDRLKAGVAVACLTRYQNLIAHESLKAHGIYYYVPGLLAHFDTEAVVALIAPRPILFQTGDQDDGSPIDGVMAIEEKVRPAFRLYDANDAFRSIVYPGVGHVYLPEMWAQTEQWMDRHLGVTRSAP
jgi:dienelactone hydrolase